MTPVGTQAQLFRATIVHTPVNPFSFETGDPQSLICFEDGGLLVRDGRIVLCDNYAAVRDAHPDAATVDWRGGFILPGFIDAHVHFPQVRIIGAMGRTLLDWLDAVALPEEARMADAGYAAETARLFLRGLAAHGTTTALVFGAHFADATAELFEAAHVSGLRIVSGLVVSDRRLRELRDAGASPSGQHTSHRAVSSPRPSPVRRDAALRVLDERIDARGVPAVDGRASRCAAPDPHQRELE
jgi:cytosine/adenosine deaminase-related metal-dependent hydrolase